MKKYIFTLVIASICICCKSKNYFSETPEGYGSATTGGGNSERVVVSTFSEFKNNLKSKDPKIILVSGTITIPPGDGISAVVTDKSIIGLPGAKLVNENQDPETAGILYLIEGSRNVIIRNLVFVGPGAYDVNGRDNLTADGVENLWVDHCEFQDGQDGNFDIKGLSDNITVSWCKFIYLKPNKTGGFGGSDDHRFSNLVGSNAEDAPLDGHYSITFQNSYWGEGVKGRMPRARNAELHILNSYYNSSVPGATGIGLGGGKNNSTAYVESSHFDKVAKIYSGSSSDGGSVAINFINSLNAPKNIGIVAPPAYSITKIAVEKVKSLITDAGCGAGATLQVTADGKILPGKCLSAK